MQVTHAKEITQRNLITGALEEVLKFTVKLDTSVRLERETKSPFVVEEARLTRERTSSGKSETVVSFTGYTEKKDGTRSVANGSHLIYTYVNVDRYAGQVTLPTGHYMGVHDKLTDDAKSALITLTEGVVEYIAADYAEQGGEL